MGDGDFGIGSRPSHACAHSKAPGTNWKRWLTLFLGRSLLCPEPRDLNAWAERVTPASAPSGWTNQLVPSSISHATETSFSCLPRAKDFLRRSLQPAKNSDSHQSISYYRFGLQTLSRLSFTLIACAILMINNSFYFSLPIIITFNFYDCDPYR